MARLKTYTHLSDAVADLSSCAWTKPSFYAGFSPDGDYCIYTRHRESEILSESNWDEIAYLFKAQAGAELEWYAEDRSALSEAPASPQRPAVYAWRASHCMVGWVEYLMVRKDAPDAVLKVAAGIVQALEAYPILHEGDYNTRQMDAMFKYWSECSLKERIDMCAEHNVSIFAARHKDAIPYEVEGDLQDSGMFV